MMRKRIAFFIRGINWFIKLFKIRKKMVTRLDKITGAILTSTYSKFIKNNNNNIIIIIIL